MPGQDCRKCANVVDNLADEVSLICHDQWRVEKAFTDLDDALERQEIADVREAAANLIECVLAAVADETVTVDELVKIKQRTRTLRAEIGDLEDYDDRENLSHAETLRLTLAARKRAASMSHQLDGASTAIHYRQGGGINRKHPWAQAGAHAQRGQRVDVSA